MGNKTNITIGAKDETTDVLNRIQKSVEALSEKVKGGFSEGEASVISFNAALELGAKAFDFLKENVGESLEKYKEMEEVSTRFSSMFANVADSVGLTKGALDRLGESVANNSLFDGTVVKSAETILLTFQDIRGEAFEKTMKTAADLASALGMQLPDATKILGKALEDPVKGFQTLHREGVIFTASQKEQIEALDKSGDKIGAMNLMLSSLATKFQGVGQALTQTGAGELTKFGQSLEDVQKAGGKVLTDFLAPLASIGTPILKSFADAVLQTGSNVERFNTATNAEIEHANELAEKTKDLLGVVDSKNESDKLTLNQYDTLLTLYPQLKGEIDIYSTSLVEAEAAVKKLQTAEKEALKTKLEQSSVNTFGQFVKADDSAKLAGKQAGRDFQGTTDLTAMSKELDYAEAQQSKFHETSGMEINYWKSYAESLREAKEKLEEYTKAKEALNNLNTNGTLEASPAGAGGPSSDDSQTLAQAAEQAKKIAHVRKEAQDAVQREAADNDRTLIAVNDAETKQWVESLKDAAIESKQIAEYNKQAGAEIQKGAEDADHLAIALDKSADTAKKGIVNTLSSGIQKLYADWQSRDAQNTQDLIANQNIALSNYQANMSVQVQTLKTQGKDSTALEIQEAQNVQAQKLVIQKEEAAAKKKAWQTNQAVQEGQIVMSTANAVMAAMAAVPFGPWNAVEAAVAGAMGAAELSLVASQPMPQFADGGIVGGTSYTGDKVLAGLNSGEMVLNATQQATLFKQANGGGGALAVHIHLDGQYYGAPTDAFVQAVYKATNKLTSTGRLVSN